MDIAFSGYLVLTVELSYLVLTVGPFLFLRIHIVPRFYDLENAWLNSAFAQTEFGAETKQDLGAPGWLS